MNESPAAWLQALAWVSLVVALACATAIVGDVLVRGHRQRMRVMEWAWPVTALYTGPVAIWAYRRYGRPNSPRWLDEQGLSAAPEKPGWATVAVGVSHCGAGCTLGDIIAEFVVFFLAITVAGKALYAEFVGDYVLAVALGLVFQFFAIAPMRGLSWRAGLVAAAKADILSLTAFEVGLFGWMAVQALLIFPSPHQIRPDSPVYWFGMQVGMCLGFLTACPVNAWLIRRGIKEPM